MINFDFYLIHFKQLFQTNLEDAAQFQMDTAKIPAI